MYNPTERLMRSRTDKVFAGVAGGIGQYLAIDPVIVRLAFVALCFTGVGIFLYPVLPGAALPDVFKQFSQTPDQPITVPPDQIDQNREQWLDAWTKTVLR